jgi:RPA family protein
MIYSLTPVFISEIKKSTYKPPNAEEKKPSYIITKFGEKVFKPIIVGTVVDKYLNQDATYMRITVNDETSSINVKIFNPLDISIEIGDVVIVWGKIREANEKFIRADFVKRVDENFEIFLKKKILKRIEEKTEWLKNALEYLELVSIEEFKDFCKESFNMDDDQIKEVLKNRLNEEKIYEIAKKLKVFSFFDLQQILGLNEEEIKGFIENLKKEGKIIEENGKYKVL